MSCIFKEGGGGKNSMKNHVLCVKKIHLLIIFMLCFFFVFNLSIQFNSVKVWMKEGFFFFFKLFSWDQVSKIDEGNNKKWEAKKKKKTPPQPEHRLTGQGDTVPAGQNRCGWGPGCSCFRMLLRSAGCHTWAPRRRGTGRPPRCWCVRGHRRRRRPAGSPQAGGDRASAGRRTPTDPRRLGRQWSPLSDTGLLNP